MPASHAPARRALRLGLTVAALLVAACGRPSVDTPAATGSPLPAGSVQIVAQSTLRSSFVSIGHAFEGVHPGTAVRFVFSSDPIVGSSAVAKRADGIAASGTTLLSLPARRRRVAFQRPFAQDQLVLITATGAGIAGLGALAGNDLRVALASPARPEGADARRALQLSGVWHRVAPRVVRLPSDAAVVQAVRTGAADAGIVYRSEVPAGSVRTVAIPGFDNVVQTYVVIAFEGPDAVRSMAFARYLASADAQAILIDHGFMASPCDCHG